MRREGLDGKSIHQHIARARSALAEAGLSPKEAELGARLLAEFALEWTTEHLLTAGHDAAPDDFQRRYASLIERRGAREPLAYIVGRQEFWGLSFAVSPAVLIPRRETELIVEAALELFPEPDRSLLAADVCTGSGCVAVALACERRSASIAATDISSAALEVARQNAACHGVADRVQLHRSDLLEDLDGSFDLIVCNPPYVADRDRRGLQPEVRDHEPDVALFGGADGFDLVERLVTSVPSRLRSGGYLLFEFGLGQDDRVESLVAATASLTLLELRRDLQGIARTAVVHRA